MSKESHFFQYKYQRPALATDCVVMGFDGNALQLLLVQREKTPFEKNWALPGGFVQIDETTEEAARKVLLEKAGLKHVFVEQLYTFCEVERDPRERIVSVVYFALVNSRQLELVAGRNTTKAEWFNLHELPTLAFDHHKIVEMALNRLRGKIGYQPIGFELLNKKFTLSQMQVLYESILGFEIDKRNFRKKILGMGLLTALDEKEKNVAHKAARYYEFDKKKYKELTQNGFHFDLNI